MDVKLDTKSVSNSAINSILDERYQLLELVGRGGSGVVYKALDLNLQREVAVKILSAECFNQPGQFERFERESQILRQLRAINTVFFYDTGKTPDGLPYFVMEFVVGKPLKTLLEEQPVLEPQRVVNILTQVFASLQEAHAIGFVHRDLKPANIMLISRVGYDYDFVKVLDFGVAKVTSDQHDDSKNELVGTPKYMAPEQFRGESVTPASDLYSMGCVAYEMLTGIPLFEGDTLHVTIAKHLFMTPPPFSGSLNQYPNLVATIFRLLQKDPLDRFECAGDVNDALAHWQEPILLETLARFIPSSDPQKNDELTALFNEDTEQKTVPLAAPSPQMIAAAIAQNNATRNTVPQPVTYNYPNNPNYNQNLQNQFPQQHLSKSPAFFDQIFQFNINGQSVQNIITENFFFIIIAASILLIILLLLAFLL